MGHRTLRKIMLCSAMVALMTGAVYLAAHQAYATPPSVAQERVGGATNRGAVRTQNEDSMGLFPASHVYVVADGMGGHAAGEIASRMAVDTVGSYIRMPVFDMATQFGPYVRSNIVLAAFKEANRRILSNSLDDRSHRGMGTTMVTAIVGEKQVDIINLGDSRAYRIRGEQIEQISHDHSLVQEYIDRGVLRTPEAIEAFPYRNVITRAIGTQPSVEADVFTQERQTGDIYLLCSDGLTNELKEDEIVRIVREHHADLDEAAQALIEAAIEAGGHDNVTVVLVEV